MAETQCSIWKTGAEPLDIKLKELHIEMQALHDEVKLLKERIIG